MYLVKFAIFDKVYFNIYIIHQKYIRNQPKIKKKRFVGQFFFIFYLRFEIISYICTVILTLDVHLWTL